MEGVSPEVRNAIAARTPGFEAWQQEEWLTCCQDAAAFLGAAGAAELQPGFSEAIPAVTEYLKANYDLEGDELEEFVGALSKDGQPTTYKSLSCGN
jgi:uncharacterized protein CbrC (UPF0167 family)